MARETLRETVLSAVNSYLSTIDGRNSAIVKATAAARELGLIEREDDPDQVHVVIGGVTAGLWIGNRRLTPAGGPVRKAEGAVRDAIAQVRRGRPA